MTTIYRTAIGPSPIATTNSPDSPNPESSHSSHRTVPSGKVWSLGPRLTVSSEDGWSLVPTSVDPNRPDPSTIVMIEPYPTSTPDSLTGSLSVTDNNEGPIDTAALVGITFSAALVVATLVFAVIWWTRRRSRSSLGSGHGSRQELGAIGGDAEEEEKPPTYEAAVFGIYRNSQGNPSLHQIPQQPIPPLASQTTPRTPPLVHHIHSPRPFNAATANRTLRRLDVNTAPPTRNNSQRDTSIVIYPHDSPPSTPQPDSLSIRSSSRINPNPTSERTLSSHHITDFSEEYPDTVSFNSDFSDDDGEAVAKEIV